MTSDLTCQIKKTTLLPSSDWLFPNVFETDKTGIAFQKHILYVRAAML